LFTRRRIIEMIFKPVSEPLGHYEQIVKLNPLQVIFVLSKSEKRETCIVLRLSERRFERVPGWLYVSAAGSGNTQLLFSYYRLAKKLSEEWNPNRCFSCILPEDKFNLLIDMESKVDLGSVISPSIEFSPWLEDLLDVKREWIRAEEELTAKYGYQVAAAQRIIRLYLSREIDSRY
jgi:hypothetical protein